MGVNMTATKSVVANFLAPGMDWNLPTKIPQLVGVLLRGFAGGGAHFFT
jgi:hypothetical protein